MLSELAPDLENRSPSLRIGINARFLSEGRPTGVHVYGRRVVEALLRDQTRAHHYVLYADPQAAIPFTGVETVRTRIGQGAWSAYMWEQTVLPLLAFRDRIDLLFNPCNVAPVLFPRNVVTIHDLSYLVNPAWFSRSSRTAYRILIRLLAPKVLALVAVSDATRKDIGRFLGVSPERVVLGIEGCDPAFRPQPAARIAATRERYGLSSPYVLSVATMEPRKNLRTLVRAFLALKRAGGGASTQLALVGQEGGRAFVATELGGVPADMAEHVRLLGYVPGDDLPALYSGATVFAYPSWYEGFGLPLLEAMACGCPVIASDAASLPEVVGTAGILVPAGDDAGLVEALARVLGNAEQQRRMRLAGLERAQAFSWDAAAAAVLEAFDRAADCRVVPAASAPR